MSEKPDDITKTARAIASSIGFLDYEDRAAVTKYIDYAIRTERERCSSIAYDHIGDAHSENFIGCEYDAWDRCASLIYEAIRPTPPKTSSEPTP